MKFESLIKRGDYPLVESKYNVDFYSNTLDEKTDETLCDIWRHYIYSKPEPKEYPNNGYQHYTLINRV